MKPKRRASARARILKDQVGWWASRIGVRPLRVQIQHMTKKWASCSPSGRICLSKDLLREDRVFQQVVIVHELLHLRVHNHGKLFKSLMSAYLPEWENVADGRIRSVCGYTYHSRSLAK
jgi:predicted metal-dependent hydrolase